MEVKVDKKTGAATLKLETGDRYILLDWLDTKLKSITDELQTDENDVKRLVSELPEFGTEGKLTALKWRSLSDYGYLLLTTTNRIPFSCSIMLASDVVQYAIKSTAY